MNTNINNSFRKMIDVNTPIICIQDYDFARIDELIKEVVGTKNVYEWNPATSKTDFKTKESKMDVPLEGFLDFYVKEELDKPIDKYLVLKDVQDYVNEQAGSTGYLDPVKTKIKTQLQLIAQRRLYDRSFSTTVIIVSTYIRLPQELDKYASYLEITFPSDEEIKELIDWHVEVNEYKESFKEGDTEKLMPSLKGLTCFEIDRMLDMAMSSNGTLTAEDQSMILQHKKQMVRKSGLLELVDTPASLDSIGGMDALKSYLQRKEKVIKNLGEAMSKGVAVPKGIFIVGMPGCGKSLCAKASAALFNTPLLKMDMGSMMGKYVGESEGNLRRAIQIAEAAAPCVLWIDEIEKAFSGVGGNNDIMTRMFGYFLSWMQDKTSSVYVIATANNADNLPPELKRKGRFDEIFCVNLPTAEERKAIFEVHLKKKKKGNLKPSDKLIKDTDGFNGADIEAVVNEAMEEGFIEKKDLNIDVLEKIASQTISISKSCKKQIDNMKKVFEESSFKDATTGSITKAK
ncbi:MAG: AAA family ATPase [Bacteroidales bacterium]|nr:AAA family ATPase [Bacteroidales bacterium]